MEIVLVSALYRDVSNIPSFGINICENRFVVGHPVTSVWQTGSHFLGTLTAWKASRPRLGEIESPDRTRLD